MRGARAGIATACALMLAACGGEEKPVTPPAPPQAAAPQAGSAPAAIPPKPAAAPVPAPAAATAIGRIDALEGDVRIGDRAAQPGSEVREGDLVRSGDNAWALLALSDGASITLRSNSELRFDRYRYAVDADAQQNSATLSLLKGAMRSITGYIGQTHRAGYEVKTPTATIGIRGTDHEPAYYTPAAAGQKQDHPPGTYDKVNSGETAIQHPAGQVIVRRGQTAFAHSDVKVRPQVLARPPAFYARHAEIDRRAAPRRAEFHRVYERERQQQIQERRLKGNAAAKGQDANKKQDQKKQETAKKAPEKARAEDRKVKVEQKAEKKAEEKKAATKKEEKKAASAREEKKKGPTPREEKKASQQKEERKAAQPQRASPPPQQQRAQEKAQQPDKQEKHDKGKKKREER